MKIKFEQSVSGPGMNFGFGEVVDINEVPNGDGPRFLRAGIATPVKEEKRTATVKAPHKAVKE